MNASHREFYLRKYDGIYHIVHSATKITYRQMDDLEAARWLLREMNRAIKRARQWR